MQDSDTRNQMELVAHGLVGRRLTYDDLTAGFLPQLSAAGQRLVHNP